MSDTEIGRHRRWGPDERVPTVRADQRRDPREVDQQRNAASHEAAGEQRPGSPGGAPGDDGGESQGEANECHNSGERGSERAHGCGEQDQFRHQPNGLATIEWCKCVGNVGVGTGGECGFESGDPAKKVYDPRRRTVGSDHAPSTSP